MSDGVRMPGVPEAQRDPVLKRYPLRRRRVPIGAANLSLVLPDDRAWLRQGSWAPAVVRGQEPPYWIRVWPVAIALARQLVRAGSLRGVRLLDLGCGVGVPGVQAAALGAEVCFVDREADALAFARWNAAAQPAALLPTTGRRLDWSLEAVPGAFDVIVLSDVTYHSSHHGPVRRQVDEVLAAGGCVLHGDPCREQSGRFLAEMRAAGFAVRQRQVPTGYDGRQVQARITLMARAEAAAGEWAGRLRFCAPGQQAPGVAAK